jgi:hypothetical protein
MSSIILLSKDLFFISKVKEVAASVGRVVVVAKSIGALREATTEGTLPGVMLMDLEKSGVPLEELAGVFSELTLNGWRGVSFFSHVHDAVGDRAKELGLGEVMPRSRFVKVLPEVLSSL